MNVDEHRLHFSSKDKVQIFFAVFIYRCFPGIANYVWMCVDGKLQREYPHIYKRPLGAICRVGHTVEPQA